MPSEEHLTEMMQIHGEHLDWGVKVKQTGRALAKSLITAGHEGAAKGVLMLIHRARGGGGGAEKVIPIWESTKVELERVELLTESRGVDHSVSSPARTSLVSDSGTGAIISATGDQPGQCSEPTHDDVLKRLGKVKLEELLTTHIGEEELHPDEIAIRRWLDGPHVSDRFQPWWTEKIEQAKAWRIPVSPFWDVIAECLDVLFLGTCNVFRLGGRPHVTEKELFPFLAARYSLTPKEIRELELPQLAALLQQALPTLDAAPATELGDYDHSPDFRSVRWFGESYTFTENQALRVKLLWENWERGTPDVEIGRAHV